MTIFSAAPGINGTRPKTITLPSGDQPASDWYSFSDSSSFGVPPSADISMIFQGPPACVSVNAISVPSGDHRGKKAVSGAYVSCRRSLPSMRLRHRFPSGYETYVTHLPSLEKSTCPAEIPERYGAH